MNFWINKKNNDLGGEEDSDRLQLQGQLLPKAPILLIIQLQKVRQPGQVMPALPLSQQGQKITQMPQNADPDLVQILHEPIKDGQKIVRDHVLAEHSADLVDARR